MGGHGPPYPVRPQSLTPSRVPAGKALAWTAYQTGNFREAERLYREALRQDPGNADVWCMVGIVCRAAGAGYLAMRRASV